MDVGYGSQEYGWRLRTHLQRLKQGLIPSSRGRTVDPHETGRWQTSKDPVTWTELPLPRGRWRDGEDRRRHLRDRTDGVSVGQYPRTTDGRNPRPPEVEVRTHTLGVTMVKKEYEVTTGGSQDRACVTLSGGMCGVLCFFLTPFLFILRLPEHGILNHSTIFKLSTSKPKDSNYSVYLFSCPVKPSPEICRSRSFLESGKPLNTITSNRTKRGSELSYTFVVGHSSCL